MSKIQSVTDGLFINRRKSIYSATTEVRDNRQHLGHDFSKDILKKSISNMLLRNDHLYGFIELLEKVLVDFINSVTYLRIYKSFTVKKDYRKVR